jgi:lactate racemase
MMFRYSCPYEFAGVLEIPDKNLLGVFEAHPHSDLPEHQIVANAIQNPVGAPRLQDFVKKSDHILLLPDDMTRQTPADRIIPHILQELDAAGVPDKDIRVLISLGTHRPMTPGELAAKLGTEVMGRFHVTNHQWDNPEAMYLVGESSCGLPIYVNREVLWANHIIGIGCVFPHAVAGFSGGGKIVVPGITNELTCGDMHWAMHNIPARELYGHAENPVRSIIDQIASEAGLDYIVDAVLDYHGRVVDMVAGHPVQAHRECCELSRRQYGVQIPERADIVIVDSFGSDIDYWQAIKALGSAAVALKDDGVVIHVASCPEGVSVSHPEVLEYGYRPLVVVSEMVERRLVSKTVAAHMIQASRVMAEGGRGFLISPGVSPREVVRLGFLYADTPQEALDRALSMKGSGASIAVLRHAGSLLPLFPGRI